jgi:UDP-glucuronate decarboxylase
MNYDLSQRVTDALTGRSVLITGSEGFLGKHFAAACQEAGAFVHGVDIRTGTDISRPYSPATRPDFIIHAAGVASPFHYRANPYRTLDAAVSGTRNMLELAERSGARLLFTSSSEIYGDPTVVPTPETYHGASDPMGDRSCYDESKRLGETLCAIAASRGVRAVVVRLFNAYGPGMADDDRRFMPELRNAKRAGRAIKIYGHGEQTRTFCYVEDTIRGCLLALTQGRAGVPYNIGNDAPEMSMLAVAKFAFVPVEQVGAPADWPSGGDPNRRCPDITRAREELGYEPVVSFGLGLQEFLKS